jgi:SCY1-like protein 2
MNLIKSLSTKIEQDHSRKLQELSTSAPNVGSRNDFMNFGGPATSRVNGLDDTNGDTNDFEALVLGKSQSSPLQDSFDTWGAGSLTTQPALSSQSQSQRQSPAPTFSWSTPSPTGSNFPPNATNRTPATTSSSTLGGFSTLQPQTKPLQPSVLSPTTTSNWSTTTTSNWSTTNPASSSVSNPWTSTTPTTSNLASNPWTSSSQSQMSSIPLGQPPRPNPVSQSSFTIAPPPSSTSPYSSFSIAPPPNRQVTNNATVSSMNNLANIQNGRKDNNQKSGLDKYESLI